MKKTFVIFTFLTALITQGQNLIIGTTSQIIWGKANTKDVILKLNYQANVKPIIMTIGHDSPNGLKFRISFKDLNVAVDLNTIISMQSGLNEFGDLADGYYVQVATYDFDSDKNPEIIIAIGDGLVNMSVNIIKYHPPTNSDDAIRTENWTVISNFEGQEKIHVDKQTIIVPIGTQGLFDEYTFVKGKIVKTN